MTLVENKPFYVDDKLAVRFHEKKSGGQWVDVTLLKSRVWTPALLQLSAILKALAICEDERYPPPGRGRDLLVNFLWDSLKTTMDEAALRAKYKLPVRPAKETVSIGDNKP